MIITLRNVRLAFPALFVPQAPPTGGDAAYQATFIFPPGSDAEKQLKAVVSAVAAEKWAAKAQTILAQIDDSANTRLIQRGDLKANYDGFAGNLFVRARNPNQPTVFGTKMLTDAAGVRKLERVLRPNQPDAPYSGCYVNGQIDVWAQDSVQWGKAIRASLLAVQFAAPGDAFAAGARVVEDAFEAVETAEDEVPF